MKNVLIFLMTFAMTSLISGVSHSQVKGTISGRVTDPSGNGLANVYVSAYNYSNNYWTMGTYTDGNGNYGLSVPKGTYKVRFFSPVSSGYYAPEWYDNRAHPDISDLVTVTAFRTTTGINATLEIGGAISGRVTNGSGSGLANVSVDAHDLNDRWIATSITDGYGNYSFTVPTGAYRLHFSPSPSNGYYAPEWYSDKRYFENGDSIPVTLAQTTPNIDAQLEIGGTISGKVTTHTGVKGIAHVYVSASDLSDNWIEGSFTNSNGQYSFNVPVGTYKVEFHPLLPTQNTLYYAPEWYNNRGYFQEADWVTVAASQATTNINGRFERGGAISGRVTDGSGNAIPNVYVQVYDQSVNTIVFATVTTDGSGSFTIPLAAGNYKVGFFPAADDGNYSPQWYNRKSDFQSAEVLTVKKLTRSAITVVLETK